jgi:uncharacterized protein (TIGR04255 family)
MRRCVYRKQLWTRRRSTRLGAMRGPGEKPCAEPRHWRYCAESLHWALQGIFGLMPTTFKNAPLVEIVAEIRWNPKPFFLSGLSGPGQLGLLNSNLCEKFFQKFLIEANAIGFPTSERLMPQGMIVIPNQVVYRLRSADSTKLLHVGIGVLSVNAVPPYHSWAQFTPILRDGLSAGFRALESFERLETIDAVSLRYIDAFTSTHMGDVDPASFMRDTLALGGPVPKAIEGILDKTKVIRSQMQLMFPLKGDLLLLINVGEGLSNNNLACVLDSTVSSAKPIPVGGIFDQLDRNYSILHELFIDLVQPIIQKLEPTDE